MDSNNEHDETMCSGNITRRDFLARTTVAGITAASLVNGHANAEEVGQISSSLGQDTQPATGNNSALYPQQNQVRNLLDLSGVWQFQLDPKDEGAATLTSRRRSRSSSGCTCGTSRTSRPAKASSAWAG